jgi:hypothetical protein
MFLVSSCILTMDNNERNSYLINLLFKKYDKNLNQTFEQSEFKPILKNIYKFEKQNHILIYKDVKLEEYLKSEFPAYDDNKDGHITLIEIESYDRKKQFTFRDKNKNGFLDVENEVSFLTDRSAYKSLISMKSKFVFNGKKVISYDEFLSKVNKKLNSNLDNLISFDEYQAFMPHYCGYM